MEWNVEFNPKLEVSKCRISQLIFIGLMLLKFRKLPAIRNHARVAIVALKIYLWSVSSKGKCFTTFTMSTQTNPTHMMRLSPMVVCYLVNAQEKKSDELSC